MRDSLVGKKLPKTKISLNTLLKLFHLEKLNNYKEMGLHCLQIKCYYTFQKCTHTIHSFCNAFILQIPNESEKHIGLQLFLKVFSDMFSKRTSSLISVHFLGGKMGAAFAKERDS